MIGGLLAFMVNPQTRLPPSVVLVQRNSALVFIAYNLFNGFSHAGIDNAAHIGGLISGFGMGWWLARPLDLTVRAHPGPKLLMGSIGGAVALVALSWPLAHPGRTVAAERHFRRQFSAFADNEEVAVAAQNQLRNLLVAKRISDQDWGRRVKTDVLPKWKLAEASIQSAPLPADSSLLPLRVATLQYLADRQLALTLQSDGAQSGNSELLQRGADLDKKIAADAGTVEGLEHNLK